MKELYFEIFKQPALLTPKTSYLGRDIRLAYDPNSQMRVTVKTVNPQGKPSLLIQSSNRQLEDWLGLEIDVPEKCRTIDIHMRYAPAERIFPRIYFKRNKARGYVDEPDRGAPSRFGTLRFDPKSWYNLAGTNQIKDCRLSLLFPASEWFVLELQEITNSNHA